MHDQVLRTGYCLSEPACVGSFFCFFLGFFFLTYGVWQRSQVSLEMFCIKYFYERLNLSCARLSDSNVFLCAHMLEDSLRHNSVQVKCAPAP